MISIGFSGDLNISGSYLKRFESGNEIFSNELLEEIRNCDYFVTNFEGAATDKDNFLRKDVRVVNPVGSIDYLSSRKINVFNLANNHLFDCGLDGFLETRERIKENKLFYFGAGQDITEASNIVYLQNNGIRLAIIGICQKEGMIADNANPGVFCETSNKVLKRRIKEAKMNADWLIVNYHGGEEYSAFPSPLKRRLLKTISKIDGVDIIISHHSHVIQGYEKVNDVPIFYSLGNFVFNLDLHENIVETQRSTLVKFNFTKKEYTFCLKPLVLDIQMGITRISDSVCNDLYLSDFSDLKRKFRNEAYRLLFTKTKIDDNIVSVESEKHPSKKYITYLYRLYYIFRNKYLRTTYLSAYYIRFQMLMKSIFKIH